MLLKNLFVQDKMTTQEIRIKKTALRKQYKNIRAIIENREEKDRLITSNLLSSMSYKYCKKILLYSSFGSEPDTWDIAKKALDDGKELYFPKSYDGGIMKFFKVKSFEDLYEGKFGIKEPSDKNEEYIPGNSTSELCIVPALCFDKDGYRIGYGKGYYDRFLSKFKGISAGIAYSDCISETPVVYEKRHDKKVDIIISEKGLELIVCK